MHGPNEVLQQKRLQQISEGMLLIVSLVSGPYRD